MDWLATLHAYTEGAVELRACPNVRGEGSTPWIYTRDAADVAAFLRRWSKPGYGVYAGVATRKPGLSRSGGVADLLELPALWADLDHKPPLDVLLTCPMPPSVIIDSGRGLHPYWLLDEPEDISAAESNDHPLVGLLRSLARVFNGDRAVCDLARIMRLPGTLNSKHQDTVEVSIIHQTDRRYSLPDLQDWLSWQRELIGDQVDPFLAAAERLGVRPAVDVQAMLAGMSYPDNVHDVQLRVSASLISGGKPEEEVVAALLEATHLAAGEAGRRWNWTKEEAGIRQMCRTAARKFVVHEGGKKQVNGPDVPAADPKSPLVGKVAAIALAVWARPIVVVEGEMWTYEVGLWSAVQEHDLRTHIHGAAREFGNVGNATLNGAWRWILEDPAHIRRGVAWDRAGVIVGTNGALDIASGALLPHSPDHWATRHIDCAIDPGATCPRWLQFLAEKTPKGCADTVQEWCGAALVRGKRRELTKGLIVHGPTRSGKTQLSEVVKALLGGNTCGLHVRAMSERFGMQPLLQASGWIADDAVGEGVAMDAEAYKVIVTGESVSVERKNKTNVETRFDMPVLLTMNAFPIVKDSSDAVYNRTLVLPMLTSESEQTATEIAKEVVQYELPGVLNWALEGWRRVRDRGWYEPPNVMKASVAEFKGHNNPISDFVQYYLAKSDSLMIYRHDLTKVFNGWYKAEFAGREKAGAFVARALRGSIDNLIGDDTQKGRVWVGLRFTEAAEPFVNTFGDMDRKTVHDLNMPISVELMEKHREQLGGKRRTKF
jgi:P4 family phage/plasmid primase-like protien